MKQILILFAVALVLAACGKEEEAPAPVEEPVAAEAEVSSVDEPTEETEEVVEETLEVVEESAAVEEESVDEPIVLALSETDEAPIEYRFQEGRDYMRLVPTQPTVGGADKIEVATLFQYSCIHCFNLEPRINGWAADLDPAVRYIRIPAPFNRVAQLHAQMFYTAELLASGGTLKEPERLHMSIFTEFHRRGNRLISKDAIQKLFARFDISAEDFEKSWSSFYVNQKMNTAADLTRRYGVNSTPTVVVNGKYVIQNVPELLDIIDELLVREGIR
jgi:thiol:disulfide interchange protein DsbA